MTTKRLFIFDPSLKDGRGHHYTATRNATLSAQKLGFEVFWLCSTELSSNLDMVSAKALPVFGATMYDSYIVKEQDRKGFLTRLRQRISPKPLPAKPDLSTTLIAALMDVINSQKITKEDRLLCHTADGAIYTAVARLCSEFTVGELPTIHICTPYDPVGVMPNRASPQDVADAIDKYREMGLLEKKVYLYAENEFLADHLASLWACRVDPLPIPVFAPSAAARENGVRLRVDNGIAADDFVIVSLGAARSEKGFNLVPELVARTLELEEAAIADKCLANIRFLLHASPQIIGRQPDIIAALEELQKFPSSKVTLLLDNLNTEDYDALLNAGDAVLVPYDTKAYRVRGSMIVAEAVAAAKPMIATSASYPGKAAAVYSGVCGETTGEIASAIIDLVQHSAAYREKARKSAEIYLQKNAAIDYFAKCVARETD